MRAFGLPKTFMLVAALLFAGAGVSTTYQAMTIDEMVGAAELAFFGEVRDVVAFEQDGDPWTRVVFQVERNLRTADDGEGDGSPPIDVGGTVELGFLGGSVAGGPTLTVALMPAFAIGDRVLVFAYRNEAASPIVGFRQAVWWVEGDALRDVDGAFLGIRDGVLVRDDVAASVQSVLDAFAELFEVLP